MDRLIRTLIITVTAALVVIAAGARRRLPLVVFFRPFSIDPTEAANSRRDSETMMAHILHPQQTYRQTRNGLIPTIRTILRTLAAEHTLALRAAEKAASPRQSLAEVRAMYVPTGQSQRQSEADAQSTKSEEICR